MRYEIKSIPIWPLIRLAFFVNLIVGFIGGIFLAIFMVPFLALVNAMAAYDTGYIDIESGSTGAVAMMLPFLSALWSACFGTLFVLIIGFVYNLTAKVIGGVECQLEPVTGSPPSSEPTAYKPDSVIDRPLPPPPTVPKQPPPPPAGEIDTSRRGPEIDGPPESQPNS